MRKRTGTLIMLAGIVLAVVAGMLVLGMTQQTRAERTAQVEQVLVVMASRDIPDGTAVTADALAMEAFPADFVPAGAIVASEEAVGKYSTTRITTGQIVLANQLSPNKRLGDLSLSVPSGKVAIALPMSDLMSTNGAIKAGDRVDVLLTVDLKEIQLKDPLEEGSDPAPAAPANNNARNPVTQTTLQNVEVLAIGQGVDVDSNGNGTSSTTAGNTANGRQQGAVILLLEPQDALVLKYAKDSGGVIDLALRAPEDTAPVTTDPITIDRLFEQFNFQRPGPVP
jgi:pilus assembly protein CpaB